MGSGEIVVLVIFNIVMLGFVSGGLWFFRSFHKNVHPAFLAFLIATGLIFMALVLIALSRVDIFCRIQFLCWAIFLHCPLLLTGFWYILLKAKSKGSYFVGGFLLILIGIAVDVFIVEPSWIQISRYTLQSEKIHTPIRIAIIADIQTNKIGGYEKRIFEKIKNEKPDLILFAGDYLQVRDQQRYMEEAEKLNQIIREAKLDPSYGMFAVIGNIDPENLCKEIFRDLDAVLISVTSNRDAGPVTLTCLSEKDSFNPDISMFQKYHKFHIVLGHCPNFSLGKIDADLLVAGHTHGGQVRLPGIGPILTMCDIPRKNAAGLTILDSSKTLIVSRGLGMERHSAPRLRFLCRPEIVIVDIEKK